MNRKQRRRLEKLNDETTYVRCRNRLKTRDAQTELATNLIDLEQKEDDLLLEVLLAATGLDKTPQNTSDATEYVRTARVLFERVENFGWYLDKLFLQTSDQKTVHFGNAAKTNVVDSLTSGLYQSYTKFSTSMNGLLNSKMSNFIGTIDNLEKKLTEACLAYRSEIIELDSLMEKVTGAAQDFDANSRAELSRFGVSREDFLQGLESDDELAFYAGLDEDGSDEDIPDEDIVDENVIYDVASFNIVNTFVETIVLLESMKFGIPNDFCKTFVDIIRTSDNKVRYFFAKEFYAHISQKEVYEKKIFTSASGQVSIRKALTTDPESMVPDTEYLRKMQSIKDLLEKTHASSYALECMLAINKVGIDYEQSLKKILAANFNRESYSKLAGILNISEGCEIFMLDLLAKNKSAMCSYDLLKLAEYDNNTILSFLRDYSCCKINGGTLSDILLKNKTKPETVKLITENALHICASDFSEEILYLATTLDKGTKGLRYYTQFEKSEEHNKSEAVVRYLMSKGASKVHKFAEGMQNYSDSDIKKISVLDDELFFKEVLEGTQEGLELLVPKPFFIPPPDVSEEELNAQTADLESWPDLSLLLPEVVIPEDLATDIYSFLPDKFQNQNLLEKYALLSDFKKMDAATLLKADEALTAIKDSKYEHALLGQRNLCANFVKCLVEKSEDIAAAMRDLPEEGNPYVVLSQRIDKLLAQEAEIPVNLNGVAQQNSLSYTRIFFVTAGIPSETVQYLENQVSIPISVVDIDASSRRFQGINESDLVIYDTTRASHKSYYRAKAQAAKVDAKFLLVNQSNKEVLLNLILSAK